MTLCVAMGRPHFALVATDTRLTAPGGQHSDVDAPFSKMQYIECGWIMSLGGIMGWFGAVRSGLVSARPRNVYGAARVVASAGTPVLSRYRAQYPRLRALSRPAAVVLVCHEPRRGYRCRPIEADGSVSGDAGYAASLPEGLRNFRVTDRLYERATRAANVATDDTGLDTLVRELARGFMAIRDHLGPAGSVGPTVEIGITRRSVRGEWETHHLTPTNSAAVASGVCPIVGWDTIEKATAVATAR